jgi:hypothetical protein
LRGDGFTRQVKPWALRDGRFYSRIIYKGHTYSLGGHSTGEEATAAYWAALERLRRGEAAVAPKKEVARPSDIRRLYLDLTFGDRDGERVVRVEADQDQSVFLLHNSLNDLHPKVKKFVIAASATGDLTEAAIAAGLTQEQIAAVLPRLKVYLQRHLQ